jgi:hypothetical protein
VAQPSTEGSGGTLYSLFKILFFLALALLAAWWVFRRREVILQALKSIIDAIAQFFRDLFRSGFTAASPAGKTGKKLPPRRPFAAFHNPFLTGRDTAWTNGQLIIYSYEALQAWAEEKGVTPRPEQTAREFCTELSARFPEINAELNRLSFLYAQAAYTASGAESADLEPVRKLWQCFYA